MISDAVRRLAPSPALSVRSGRGCNDLGCRKAFSTKSKNQYIDSTNLCNDLGCRKAFSTVVLSGCDVQEESAMISDAVRRLAPARAKNFEPPHIVQGSLMP